MQAVSNLKQPNPALHRTRMQPLLVVAGSFPALSPAAVAPVNLVVRRSSRGIMVAADLSPRFSINV